MSFGAGAVRKGLIDQLSMEGLLQLILIRGSAGVLGRICGCLWLSPVSVKWNRGKGSKARLEEARLGRL